jgi:hypothetical protein
LSINNDHDLYPEVLGSLLGQEKGAILSVFVVFMSLQEDEVIVPQTGYDSFLPDPIRSMYILSFNVTLSAVPIHNT